MSKRVYIIAEAGVNHNGSIDIATELINVAADAGANAVKFQTFRAEELTIKSAPKASYQIKNTDIEESQYDMIKKLELSEHAHKVLLKHCRTRGIEFLSTPFDLKSIELLARKLELARLKLPSGELTNSLLLLKAAQTGKPLILSTGMSDLREIENALGVLAFGYTQAEEKPSLMAFHKAFYSEVGQVALKKNLILLHCTSEYPAPFEDVNLKAMDTLRSAFGLPVGLSDHTPGIAITIAAAARGACAIEKHFTLDKNLPGPDHKASLEPDELKLMVRSIREVECALGNGLKIPSSGEINNREIVRKSVVAARNIKRGELLDETNLTVKRPGNGISPMNFWELMGQEAEKDYHEDELVNQ
ncbi:MAG: N-acetylneuraminate synthase [Bacillota bacterium]